MAKIHSISSQHAYVHACAIKYPDGTIWKIATKHHQLIVNDFHCFHSSLVLCRSFISYLCCFRDTYTVRLYLPAVQTLDSLRAWSSPLSETLGEKVQMEEWHIVYYETNMPNLSWGSDGCQRLEPAGWSWETTNNCFSTIHFGQLHRQENQSPNGTYVILLMHRWWLGKNKYFRKMGKKGQRKHKKECTQRQWGNSEWRETEDSTKARKWHQFSARLQPLFLEFSMKQCSAVHHSLTHEVNCHSTQTWLNNVGQEDVQ